MSLANAAKDKTFQDKGNEEVISKLREFGVQSFAASKKASGSKGGGGKRDAYYSSTDDEDEYSDEDEFERELQRRRKWTKRQKKRSRSRSRGRSKYDDVSISTMTGLPRDCSPPVRTIRRQEKSDSIGTYVSD